MTTTVVSGSSFHFTNNETVYAVWNTVAGGNSTPATVGVNRGNYYFSEKPVYACDYNLSTSYTNFGACNSTTSALGCGVDTGFYMTPRQGPSLIVGIQLCTAAYLPTRDPITITFEGSNSPESDLSIGSSWTLLYRGSSGLAVDPGRSKCGLPQFFMNNSIWFTSYRFLVTSKRGSESSTRYADIIFIPG